MTKKAFGFYMTLPSLVFMFLTTIVPVVFLWRWSFLNYTLYRPQDVYWNSFRNYIRALAQDPQFYQSLAITVLYVVLAISIQIVVGLFIAALLNRELAGSRLVSALMIAPMVIPPIVTGLMWRMMYWESSGVFNGILAAIGLPGLPWLGATRTALLSLVITDSWQWTPFVALVLLTGLRGLPQEPLEAAEIDGASGWQKFSLVVVPMLRPILVVVVLLRLIWILREFDLIYMMTSGGPGNATRTLSFYIFQNGMNFLQVGYSSAMSIILLNLAIFLASRLLKLFPQEGG